MKLNNAAEKIIKEVTRSVNSGDVTIRVVPKHGGSNSLKLKVPVGRLLLLKDSEDEGSQFLGDYERARSSKKPYGFLIEVRSLATSVISFPDDGSFDSVPLNETIVFGFRGLGDSLLPLLPRETKKLHQSIQESLLRGEPAQKIIYGKLDRTLERRVADELETAMSDELVRRVMLSEAATFSGSEFETVCAALLKCLNPLSDVIHRGGRGDLGCDIIINNYTESLWLNGAPSDSVVVSCKALKNSVGPEIVRELAGAMDDRRITAVKAVSGMLISLNGSTQAAKEAASGLAKIGKEIELISIHRLRRMVLEKVEENRMRAASESRIEALGSNVVFDD